MKQLALISSILYILSSCTNPGNLGSDDIEDSAGYDYVQLDSYENFSVLMLGEMDAFIELLEKYDRDVIFVRSYKTVIGADATEFAFPYEETLIVVKGHGYRRLHDYQDAKSKEILNALDYYDRKSRGFPYIRNFSYFIE